MRKIRHLNILVVFMLLLQLVVYPVNALGSENASITVEQAVQIVKDNFSIPEKYTQLSTGYHDDNNRATYSINWNAVSADEARGSFGAQVDATTGDILNIHQWEHSQKPAFKLPVLSTAEAEKIATGLVTKLAAKHQAEMQLVNDDQQVFTLNYMEPFTYNFRWIRVVNGIQFPGNGVNVSISGDGQVRNYNYNWTPDLVFPEASNAISLEKAYQVFKETPMIELQYFLPHRRGPRTPETQPVLLVYQLGNQYNGGAIDALSGLPVTIEPAVGMHQSVGSVSSVAVATLAKGSTSVLESPTNQVTQETEQQISRDEAVDVVKKMVKIPKGLDLRNSSMDTDWQNPNEQVWDLDWYSDSSNRGETQYLNARVNAKTGELVSFHRSDATNSDSKSKRLTRDGAQKVAQEFLQGVQPEKFKLVKKGPGGFYGDGESDDVQMFNYVRVANDIPVSNNGMNIAVDTIGKQVMNYDLTWSNTEFPSASKVLPLDQATERFLKERPLVLNYSLVFQQNRKEEVRLVYQPNTSDSGYMSSLLDATTGEPVDWYGKTQSQWAKAHHYTDIQGNYAEKEISVMGLTGAFGEYGESFRPDEKITAGSLLRAMLIAEGNNRDRVLSDEDVLKIAKERDWIKNDLNLKAELSRVDLAKIMVRLIHMEPSAQIKGIYAVPFSDASTIQSDSLGYIALTWGLGMLKIEGDAVQPDRSVTRAEAAYALVHAYALETRNSNIK